MCCDLQTHVRVIAIVCIVLITAATGAIGYQVLYEGNRNALMGICVLFAVYVIHWFSYIICLVGAQKRNKCLLIPSIIVTSLHILLWIGLGILIIVLLPTAALLLDILSFGLFSQGDRNEIATIGGVLFFLLIIPVLTGLGLSIYFLTVVGMFSNEISSGVVSGHQQDR